MNPLTRRLALAGAIAISVFPWVARAQALAFADSAFRRRDWAAASAAYERITAQEPADGLARFRLADTLALARYPCRTMKQAQQFDFWIGQWDVTPWSGVLNPNAPPGFNDVHAILEHCIVFENWKGPGGGEGKSFNYFDTNLNKWRQIWMDDSGSALDYTGEFRDGAMRFTGWTLDAQGHRVEQKLTFTPIDINTVRQTFEASSDGGKTWAVTFDGRYVRRK